MQTGGAEFLFAEPVHFVRAGDAVLQGLLLLIFDRLSMHTIQYLI